mgnify:CR=1 FL=1
MTNLKNINFMSKTQFDGLSTLEDNELYAVNTPAVVDSYSDDSGNWYRVYSDGWVEQGGLVTVGGGWETKNLLKPFSNTMYYIDCYMVAGGSGTNYYFGDNKLSARTTTTFTVGTGQAEGCTLAWFACGRGA